MTLKEFVDEFLTPMQYIEIYPQLFNNNPLFEGFVIDLPQNLCDFLVFQVLNGMHNESLAIFLRDKEE